jgi:hypothetical protein
MKIDNNELEYVYKEMVKERNRQIKSSSEWNYYCGVVTALEIIQTLDKEIDLSNNNDSLKDYALSAIEDLEEDGHDLTDSCYMFHWRYDERPDVLVTLVLGDFEYLEDDRGDLH